MLDLCLIGTGGTLPLTKRWLTSLLIRYRGSSILIDCGEGTQIAAQCASMSLKPVDLLLLTHLHADHISGLPGLLLTMGNMGKTSPLRIVGPAGTRRVVESLCCIAQGIGFELQIEEWEKERETISFLDMEVTAFRVLHGIICYGYSFELKRKGKFDPTRARELPIPVQAWGILQSGETYEHEGITYTPDQVMGAERSGLKLTYCTDTRPVPIIKEMAANSDLFICEGMYGEDEMLMKALENRHMLFSEAAELARDAGGVKELWLTHYSPSMPNPRAYLDKATRHFERTKTARDGWVKTLTFSDDEGEAQGE